MNAQSLFQSPVAHASLDESTGIATLTLQMPGRVNKINPDFGQGLAEAFEAVLATPGLKGIILASGHKDFCVGADLDRLFPERDPAAILGLVRSLNALYRRIEGGGVPVVAAITGSALGGGYELCLACHHRIALDDASIQIGLPEVNLGVIPGAGGTQRLPRLIGVQAAMEAIATAQIHRAPKARGAGLVDDLAQDRDDLRARATAFILANPGAKQPWDRPGFSYPGLQPDSEDGRGLFVAACAMLYKRTAGAFPAAEAVISVVQEGSRLSFDRALEVEARAFAKLATSDQAKDMIRTFWFHKNAADRHEGLPTADADGVRKVGIIGAGMMGSGLAFVCASRGYDVVLKDISADVLARASAHCEAQVGKRLRHLDAAAKAALLAKIRPTLDVADLAECDLIIEAVIEDMDIKHRVIRETEAVMSTTGLFASNTSSLPISDLADASLRPDLFLGLHFFSPVEQMPLVEVIRGAETSEAAIGRALAFVRQIKKTPILVGDGYGFFTTRVFMAYVNEGANLVAEGHNPAVIEWAARTAGMVVPPLQVTDEVSLSLGRHVLDEAASYLGASVLEQPGVRVLVSMVEDLGRPGKAAGAGYYEYKDGRRQGLWPGLAGLVDPALGATGPTGVEELGRRLLAVQALEAVRALESGVLRQARDGDVGAVFGVGFAPGTGGPFAWLDRQPLPELLAWLDGLAARHGPRYAPPALLRQMAARGDRFYPAA